MLKKIISGGQTGVDRGALDACLAKNFPCGGWCPENRMAEDGILDEKYPLQPLEKAGYRQRTRQNVIDSDSTIIIYYQEIILKGGTELTLATCIKQKKPYLLLDSSLLSEEIASQAVFEFLQRHDIEILNFAGCRGSGVPTIQPYTEKLVHLLLKKINPE